MKKHIISHKALLACTAVLALSVTACGKEKTSMDYEYDVNEYVTLCDYEGIDVAITEDYSTESALTSLIGTSYVPDETATIVYEDSIVNVDYTGYQDGEEFQGGAATDVMLDVGGNCAAGGTTSYIDGFTSGLAGAEAGSTVEYEVTFPENYGVDSLNGQTVIFSFTINYIAREMTLDDLTDEYVESHYAANGYNTVEALTEAAEDYAESLRDQDIRGQVIAYMEEYCEVTIPEELLQMRTDEYITRYKTVYLDDDTTFEEFLASYNMTEEEFLQTVQDTMEQNLEDELIFEAVALKEGIEFDEEDYASYVQEMIINNSLTDETDLYENFGANAEAGEAYLRKMYVANKACDYVVSLANISE